MPHWLNFTSLPFFSERETKPTIIKEPTSSLRWHLLGTTLVKDLEETCFDFYGSRRSQIMSVDGRSKFHSCLYSFLVKSVKMYLRPTRWEERL